MNFFFRIPPQIAHAVEGREFSRSIKTWSMEKHKFCFEQLGDKAISELVPAKYPAWPVLPQSLLLSSA